MNDRSKEHSNRGDPAPWTLNSYSPGLLTEYEKPKIPLRCTSGSGGGGGAASARGGGGAGAGKLSHFME
jgi:hypothetical protein